MAFNKNPAFPRYLSKYPDEGRAIHTTQHQKEHVAYLELRIDNDRESDHHKNMAKETPDFWRQSWSNRNAELGVSHKIKTHTAHVRIH